MFDSRQDLVKFLAVAEAGKILAAAERLSIGQPAITRAIARIERRLGGRLFERLPTGVRLTPLGAVAVELARGLLREIETAEEKIEAAVSGRAGRFRITATPVWMQAVLAPAIARYREALPGVELALRTAPFAEGLRLLENGESDLHCGGADPGRPLPAFLRRERFIELTAAIVAGDGHPLLTRRPSVRDLSGYPWIDYDAPALSPGARPRISRRSGRWSGPCARPPCSGARNCPVRSERPSGDRVRLCHSTPAAGGLPCPSDSRPLAGTPGRFRFQLRDRDRNAGDAAAIEAIPCRRPKSCTPNCGSEGIEVSFGDCGH